MTLQQLVKNSANTLPNKNIFKIHSILPQKESKLLLRQTCNSELNLASTQKSELELSSASSSCTESCFGTKPSMTRESKS